MRVFSCFFFGLGLGSALAAVYVGRISRPFLVLARLEIGIIILTLPILFLPQLTDWIWPRVDPELLVAWQGLDSLFPIGSKPSSKRPTRTCV